MFDILTKNDIFVKTAKGLLFDRFVKICQNDLMGKTKNIDIEDRKRDILEGALKCFLNFGFSKTSMDDVAKEVGISRPLIYLKFKNKEDLLLGLFDYIMESPMEEAVEIAAASGSRREKLERFTEVLYVGPWGRISGKPMSDEFFNSCCTLDEKHFEKFEKLKLKLLGEILGDKLEAEVFALSCDGLFEDQPSLNVLKKRLSVLVEKFSP